MRAPGSWAGRCATRCSAGRSRTSTWPSTASPRGGRGDPRAPPAVADLPSERRVRRVAGDRALTARGWPTSRRSGADDRGRPAQARLHDQRDRGAARRGGEPIDPHGGLADLERRVLRVLGEAPTATTRCARCGSCGSPPSSTLAPDPRTRERLPRRRPRRASPRPRPSASSPSCAAWSWPTACSTAWSWPTSSASTARCCPSSTDLQRRRAEPLPPPRRPRPHARGAAGAARARARPGARLRRRAGRRGCAPCSTSRWRTSSRAGRRCASRRSSTTSASRPRAACCPTAASRSSDTTRSARR